MTIRKNRWAALFFRIESEFWRTAYRIQRSYPSSDPFVSGDGFRSLADICLDEAPRTLEKTRDLTRGRVIFIRGEILDRIKSLLVLPRRPFVLITHNSDWGPGPEAAAWWKEVAPQGSCWFAQNCQVRASGIVPIPIGLENKRFHSHGVVADFRQHRRKLAEGRVAKKPWVLYGFAVENNPRERRPALLSLQKCPIAHAIPRINSRLYRELLLESMAVASPAGNGLDTHRTWEAFYVRTIPIVTRSRLTEEWPHLPWMVIRSWQDIESFRESDLLELYRQIPQDAWDSPELRMSYWRRRVSETVL